MLVECAILVLRLLFQQVHFKSSNLDLKNGDVNRENPDIESVLNLRKRPLNLSHFDVLSRQNWQ